jgi:hypothetical protein
MRPIDKGVISVTHRMLEKALSGGFSQIEENYSNEANPSVLAVGNAHPIHGQTCGAIASTSDIREGRPAARSADGQRAFARGGVD